MSRRNLNEIRRDFKRKIISDLSAYKRTILKEFNSLISDIPADLTSPDFLQQLDNFLRNKTFTDAQLKIAEEIKTTYNKIGNTWEQYYSKITSKNLIIPADKYEELVAVSSMSFPSLKESTQTTIMNQFTRSLQEGYSFETVKLNLAKSSLGTHEIYTLANSSVAQFDNAYNVETAQQAGITKFIYDGTRSLNTRNFCSERMGKIFTLEELDQMDNGQGLPVLYSLGGYNCVHYLTPVIDDL